MGACLGACSLLSCVSRDPRVRLRRLLFLWPRTFILSFSSKQFLLSLFSKLVFRGPSPCPWTPASLGIVTPIRGPRAQGRLASGARVTAGEGLGRAGAGECCGLGGRPCREVGRLRPEPGVGVRASAPPRPTWSCPCGAPLTLCVACQGPASAVRPSLSL